MRKQKYTNNNINAFILNKTVLFLPIDNKNHPAYRLKFDNSANNAFAAILILVEFVVIPI